MYLEKVLNVLDMKVYKSILYLPFQVLGSSKLCIRIQYPPHNSHSQCPLRRLTT
jgi:hypothetical protein